MSHDHFRLLMLNAPDLMAHVAHGLVTWVSPSVATILGGEIRDWLSAPVRELVHPDDGAVLADMSRCLEYGGTAMGRMRVRTLNGEPRWLEVHAQTFLDGRGLPDGVLASCRPADETVRTEALLRRMAASDALTGLPNRREVERRLALGLRHGGCVAALFCDIDHFKTINDSFGHAAGDIVLRTLGDRLLTVVRDGDVVARLGGDELLVLLEGVADLAEAERLATEIAAAASLPMLVMGRAVQVTLSIGVTMMSPTDDMESVLDRADMAMYRAKQFGRNRVVVIPGPRHLPDQAPFEVVATG